MIKYLLFQFNLLPVRTESNIWRYSRSGLEPPEPYGWFWMSFDNWERQSAVGWDDFPGAGAIIKSLLFSEEILWDSASFILNFFSNSVSWSRANAGMFIFIFSRKRAVLKVFRLAWPASPAAIGSRRHLNRATSSNWRYVRFLWYSDSHVAL